MKTRILIMALLAVPALALADDSGVEWRACIRYWYHENISTNVPPFDEIAEMSMADGVQSIAWQITNAPPTKAALAALEPAAIVWSADYAKTEAAGYENWTNEKLRAVIKLMVIEINKLRQELSLPTYSKAQVEAALAAEM